MANNTAASGTHWFVGDGFIFDELAPRFHTSTGRPRECSAKLFIYNPQSKAARVHANFYHPDRAATGIDLAVKAGAIHVVELAELSEIPHRQSFWIEVISDVPTLPQVRHEDYTFWDPVPDAMVSPTPYPGPLKDEASWVHPDCYQGGAQSWFEQEILSILNPGPEAVKARIRYLLRGAEGGAEEEITIAAGRIAQINVWERTPRLLGNRNGPQVVIQGDYAVRIEATGPVISQSTRRARWRGHTPVIGSRGSIGVPLRKPTPKVWYYPGGLFLQRPKFPRQPDAQPWARSDVAWNLLFTHNLDPTHPADATLTFHGTDGRTTSGALHIPPLKSDLQWLFHKPWIDSHTHLDQPFAMTIASESPIVAEVCNAEFELWSQVCPGAMSSVNFHPGPLKHEKTWWLGIGQAGGSDDSPVQWEQSWHLFNPGEKTARVKLSFLGLAGAKPVEHAMELRAGAVACVSSNDIADLPVGQPFVVRADSDVPICAQSFAFTFTRGLPYVRGMYSLMGVPMAF